MFGTYQAEEEEPTYGLVKPLRTYNPIRIELDGFRWLFRRIARAATVPEGVRALVSPPEAQVRPNAEP